jgi:RecA-family ATPase
MKYVDYNWDLRSDKIVLDQEINIDKLGWKAGDLFEVKNINGQTELIKVDPVVKFFRGYK